MLSDHITESVYRYILMILMILMMLMILILIYGPSHMHCQRLGGISLDSHSTLLLLLDLSTHEVQQQKKFATSVMVG